MTDTDENLEQRLHTAQQLLLAAHRACSEHSGDPAKWAELALRLEDYGVLLTRCQSLAKAEPFLRQSSMTWLDLAHRSQTEAALDLRAASPWERAAEVCFNAQKYTEAAEALAEALAVVDSRLTSQPQDQLASLTLARLDANRSLLAEKMGDRHTAVLAARKAFAQAKLAAHRDPSNKETRALIPSGLAQNARLAMRAGKLESALRDFDEALAIWQQQPDDIIARGTQAYEYALAMVQRATLDNPPPRALLARALHVLDTASEARQLSEEEEELCDSILEMARAFEELKSVTDELTGKT